MFNVLLIKERQLELAATYLNECATMILSLEMKFLVELSHQFLIIIKSFQSTIFRSEKHIKQQSDTVKSSSIYFTYSAFLYLYTSFCFSSREHYSFSTSETMLSSSSFFHHVMLYEYADRYVVQICCSA